LIIPPQWTTEADLIAVLDTYDLGATRTVLLTPPLGGWAGRSNVLPRAVAFTIKSHDQGWARPSERAYGLSLAFLFLVLSDECQATIAILGLGSKR